MAREQETLLEQLSRDKLFSIYQFLLLESHALEELSRSSSKEEMIATLAHVLSQEEAEYCVEFFENYEFYDVPAMKWAMLNALPDELLGTLHTIYLDDFAIVEEHSELVDRLSQSPYFLKEDARKFYLWYHYFRKRITLEQIESSSSSGAFAVSSSLQTQRMTLQDADDQPLFSMESHGSVIGVESAPPSFAGAPTPVDDLAAPAGVAAGSTLAGGSVGRGSTAIPPPPPAREVSSPVPAPAALERDSANPFGAKAATGPTPSAAPAASTLGPSTAARQSERIGITSVGGGPAPNNSVNSTIEINALNIEAYLTEEEDNDGADEGTASSRRNEPTRIDHSFARVLEEMRKQEAAKTPSSHSRDTPVDAAGDEQEEPFLASTVIIDTMELNAAMTRVDALEEAASQSGLSNIPEESVDEEPLALSDEDMLVDSVSLETDGDSIELSASDVAELDESDAEVMELEPLEEEEAPQPLDESALVEESPGTVEEEPTPGGTWVGPPPPPKDERADAAAKGGNGAERPTGPPPPPPHNGTESSGQASAQGTANGSGAGSAASGSRLPPPPGSPEGPKFSMPVFGAATLTRSQLDSITTLLYRISLLGAPYGRTQIRAIRIFMQKILGSDPPQLRWVRDKLKELQSQDLPLVPPPLDEVRELVPKLSYGMRLHLLHSGIFLLGVKTLNTLERYHEFLHDLAVELGVAPDDVSFFQLFNIGRDDIQLSVIDCLELFGLELGATEGEIRKAHRSLARRFHPDKFHSLGPEFLRMAERKMKEANMALELLLYRADRNL